VARVDLGSASTCSAYWSLRCVGLSQTLLRSATTPVESTSGRLRDDPNRREARAVARGPPLTTVRSINRATADAITVTLEGTVNCPASLTCRLSSFLSAT
jgi:hypothetical protein